MIAAEEFLNMIFTILLAMWKMKRKLRSILL